MHSVNIGFKMLIAQDTAKPLRSVIPQFLSALLNNRLAYATGNLFSKPLSSCDWLKNAPKPMREASVSRQKKLSKLGNF